MKPSVFVFTAAALAVVDSFLLRAPLPWHNHALFQKQSISIAKQSPAISSALHMSSIADDEASQAPRTSPEEATSILAFRHFELEATKANGGLFFASLVIMASLFLYLNTLSSSVWYGWTTSEIVDRVAFDVWGLYSVALRDSPIFTKACTSATVYTIGDIIAQRSEGEGPLDPLRVLRSLAAGGLGHGPLSHYWYNICDGFFDNVLHWTAWWVLFPKVVVDQILWGPFWNNMYITMLGLFKREDPSQIWDDIKRTTVPLAVAGLKLWPAAHLVTYGLVPVENRLLWVDYVEIAWVAILASQASGTKLTSVDPANEQTEETKAAF